ncbi:Cystatin-A2 [Armadillidium vulgare]|nr:Cystatin-A2 [Armadillidium vulgare]
MPMIEEHLGKPLDTIDVHSYKTQLRTGDDEFAHVRIYKHFKGDTSVHSLQKEKKEHEEIAYF